MKILFLDVDGVLNSVRSCYALGGYPHCTDERDIQRFDNVAVGFVRRLVKETGCSIVLSSTWRLTQPFIKFGEDLGIPVIDRTPRLDGIRGLEIKHWLDRNHWTKYAIVDDDSDMLEEQRPYFVQTTGRDGLMLEHYERLKELLS